jgi:hypothetical protein
MKKLGLVIGAGLLASSCATIFSGGTETVVINTSNNENNVEARIDSPQGSYNTTLPTTFTGKPKLGKEVVITVTDKCYQQTTTVVPESLDGIAFLNFFGLVGWGVDAATGAMFDFDTPVTVNLQKKDGVDGCGEDKSKSPSS